MVTYYLVNKSDEKLVYEYYPEDKKEFKRKRTSNDTF